MKRYALAGKLCEDAYLIQWWVPGRQARCGDMVLTGKQAKAFCKRHGLDFPYTI